MCPDFRGVFAHAFHIKTAVLRRVYADVRAHRKIGTAILKPDFCTILIHCDPFCTYGYWYVLVPTGKLLCLNGASCLRVL